MISDVHSRVYRRLGVSTGEIFLTIQELLRLLLHPLVILLGVEETDRGFVPKDLHQISFLSCIVDC